MSDYQEKCAIENGILHPCSELDKAIADEYPSQQKGVILMNIRNLTPGSGFKVTRSAAVLRSGDLDKNGVIMNYCPFCGVSIADHFPVSDGGTEHD